MNAGVFSRVAGAALVIVCTASCGGGGGGGSSTGATGPGTNPTTPPAPPTGQSFELRDPTPGAGDQFGEHIVVLANGNIVVSDPNDASSVPSGGAVHLFSSATKTLIASIYGDIAFDQLGSGGVFALANSNFVIASPLDDENGVVDAGSVRLVDGSSGEQIGGTIFGAVLSDRVGSGGIVPLGNSNVVVLSPLENRGAVVDAGSVRLFNGVSGAQIGSTLSGGIAGDQIGSGGVSALGNANYVVLSPFDDENGVTNAGSVRLFSGVSGAQIGVTFAGDVTNDYAGLAVTVLGNNNFVLSSPDDDEGGVVDAGSVRLISGASGAQIGTTLSGNNTSDLFGMRVTATTNDHFVFASPFDDVSGLVNAGSVQLVSGATGSPIGSALAGDSAHDSLGSESVVALSNGNVVIASPLDDENGVINAGSVRLIDGTAGTQIGVALAGDNPEDSLGLSSTDAGVTALANGNYLVASRFDDESGITDAGSLRLVSGTSGVQIGNTLFGDRADDNIGFGSVTPLGNGNVLVSSSLDDENSIFNAGSFRLVSGTTGAQLGSTFAGDTGSDMFGASGTDVLADNHCVVVLPFDDVDGVINAGTIRLIDGSTGAQLGDTLVGSAMGDMELVTIERSASGDFYVLGLGKTNRDNLVDVGVVHLITR